MNEQTITLKSEVDLLATAWDWVLRLREDDADQTSLTEWLQWYEADDRHKQAFEEMQAFWREAGKLAPAATPAFKLTRSAKRGFTPVRLMLAAACVLAVVAGMLWLPLREGAYVKETHLPDGSKVELAAKSSVNVQYTKGERLLEMNGGEAYFSVAKNPNRPFIVKVGELRVRAVGTAFNIRRTHERTVVTVTEGVVDVYSGSPVSNRLPRQRLRSGNQFAWSEDAPAEPQVSMVDPDHALAWRKGRLEYLNEPLASVITDINRYAKHPVVIRDEAVGRILFSGTVFTDATDAWLQGLPRVFPVDVETQSDGVLILTNRQ